jgi:signal transduction histidine kinase
MRLHSVLNQIKLPESPEVGILKSDSNKCRLTGVDGLNLAVFGGFCRPAFWGLFKTMGNGFAHRLAKFCQHGSRKAYGLRIIAVFPLVVALPTAATAASKTGFVNTMTTVSLSVLLLAIVVFFWALFVVRKLMRSEAGARNRLKHLEGRLNEAEAVMRAEPGVLIIWRGREGNPQTVTGAMFDTVDIPDDQEKLLDFFHWLADESAQALSDNLETLRVSGQAFNIGIQTRKGELLEADGRTAGGTATLRFRPLLGDRRHNTELAYETRRLGKQVHRLSAIIDHAPFPIWLNDRNGKLVWVNNAYMKAVDAPRIETVLEQSIRLIDEDKIKRAENENDDIGGGGGDGDVSDNLQTRAEVIISGNRRTMDFYKTNIESDDANFAVDMTALANVQHELDLLNKAHASTLDKLATAIAIFGPDQNLRFYNAAYAKLWKLDTNWLDMHPSDSEILDKLRSNRLLPEQANYRSWKEDVLSAYKSLESQESWWHLPDGQSIQVISEQHPFGGVTYLYENATEQINLESRYNTLNSIQTETLNNLDEGVALFGSDGKLQLHNVAFSRFWNLQEEFLDRKPHVDEIIKKCLPLFDDRGIWQDLKFCITSLNDKRKTLKDRISRSDDKVFDCEAIPLPDGNTLVTYLDVSASASNERALRERNEALEAADRLKTHFLSNVSYELRTPLTNILGFAEGLSIGIAGQLTEKQQEYLGHIQVSSNDLLAVIDAILDLTTIDAGAMELHLCDVDVATLLENTARSMADKIKRFDLTLNIEIAENVSTLVADEVRLKQVLGNLLSNAIGFSPQKGTVRLGAKRDGQDIVIWVADTGRGMDPEFQKRAFERFQSMPISSGHRGPGLGLAIVRSFVELHDGSVTLLSKLEKGTTVVCRLPIAGPKVDDDEIHQNTSFDDAG